MRLQLVGEEGRCLLLRHLAYPGVLVSLTWGRSLKETCTVVLFIHNELLEQAVPAVDS